MSTVSTRSLRLACDLGRPDAALDPRTNLAPAALRGAALLLQVAAFRDGAIVDVSNVASLVVIARVVSNGEVGEVQFTASTAELTACTAEQWESVLGQHAQIEIAADDLDLAAGRYRLIVYAVTTAGERVPWGHTTLTIVDAGLPAQDAPTPADDHRDDAAMLARYLPVAADGAAMKRGSADIEAAAQSVAVVFTTPFAEVPSFVRVWGIKPDAAGSNFFPVLRKDTITAAGFTVELPGPLAAGHALGWLACL